MLKFKKDNMIYGIGSRVKLIEVYQTFPGYNNVENIPEGTEGVVVDTHFIPGSITPLEILFYGEKEPLWVNALRNTIEVLTECEE